MENTEHFAREAADRYRARISAREDLRTVISKLLREGHNMTDVAKMTGIKRTTIYYIMWGKDGKDGRVQSAR